MYYQSEIKVYIKSKQNIYNYVNNVYGCNEVNNECESMVFLI